jgi:hypothetical protein
MMNLARSRSHVILVFLAALAGCAILPPPAAPAPVVPTHVRLIDAEQAKAGCTLVGKVELYKQIVVGGMPAAQLRVREKVAKAGGNAYVVTSQYLGPHGLFDIKADAYRCKP